MISFMYLGKYGRMSNQMFEISATIGTAIKYNQEYTFNAWKYNKYYKNPIPTGRNKSFRSYNEPHFHYNEIQLTGNSNWDLKGYYQSEKYFEHCRDAIRWHFDLKDEYRKKILDKYPFLNDNNTCGIHVRRGDFLQLKQYHNVMPLEYYRKAIDHLYGDNKDDINFVVCSDDIEWCKQNFPELGLKFTFIEGNENIIDLHILSMCQDNIGSASSFSWWASWLNKNENKNIVMPKDWFGPKYADRHDTKDLIPNGWVRL